MPILINPDFTRLPAPLAATFAAAAQRSFFNCPAWYESFATHAVPSDATVRLYTAGEGETDVALLCRGAVEDQLRVLSSLSSYYSCGHEPIWRGDGRRAADALTGIIGEIGQEVPRWDVVTLRALDPAGETYDALKTGLRGAAMAVEPTFDYGVWYEETVGLSFAEYRRRRPSILLNTWRRKEKKARAHLHFSFYAGPDDVEDGIAQYETIYRSSWKRAEPYPNFVPDLMRACAAIGALRMGICSYDGVPAAGQFWIVWHGQATIYKLAHDERFDEHSLGTLLTMQMMERVLDTDRPAEVDFGRGDDPYKKLWLPQRRERWALNAASYRTPRGLRLALRSHAARLYHRLRPRPQAGEH